MARFTAPARVAPASWDAQYGRNLLHGKLWGSMPSGAKVSHGAEGVGHNRRGDVQTVSWGLRIHHSTTRPKIHQAAEAQELHLAGRITARARETAGLRCAPLMEAVL